MNVRTGGRILVDALAINGADTVYCVPGESYLAALDALYDAHGVRTIACRHEAAAANMADAYGKLTGRPGIAFVTRGPGATHASIGIHTAMQDSSPAILFVGQVARTMLGREAFQEIDVPRVFGGLAKWAVQIDDARRIPEIVTRAFATATSGRPGPVVIALPEDMLRDEVSVEDCPAAVPVQATATAGDLAALEDLLMQADRPLAMLGGSAWTAEGCAAFTRFAERHQLPVACAFRRQHLFDNRHPLYIGDVGVGVNPALAKRVRDADLIIAVGPRLGEATTSGYTLIEAPRPKQRLVHVHGDASELGRIYAADLAILSNPANFSKALEGTPPPSSASHRWTEWTQAARADYQTSRELGSPRGAFDLASAVLHLNDVLPDDSIVCNGAGNFAGWVHRYYQYKQFATQLAPASGAMGAAVPSAIAAKLHYPERTVVGFAGDGDFLMSGQELATAVQYGANAIFLVVNNGMYGTIRMHQERDYPGRTIATDLVNPDFVQFAHAFGAYGEAVERSEDFPAAFARAQKSGRPALLELRVDRDAITTRTTLTEMRAKARSSS